MLHVGYSSLTYFNPAVAAREQGRSPDTASLGSSMKGVSAIMAGSYSRLSHTESPESRQGGLDNGVIEFRGQ